MNGFLWGRWTPGPSLQPAQRSPAQECGRSTFLPGSGDRCRHARGRREGHPPTGTKIDNFFFFFLLLYIIFFVYIYIYIIAEHKHIYIWSRSTPGTAQTPHHPSPRWVRTLHFPLRGKVPGARTDPGRSL